MAERRMFSKTIIDSDAFLDMPLSTQALYFHLSMRADDDGFVNNPKKIQRIIGCGDDDLKLLMVKKFLIPFESGIVVIKHWKIHNYIAKDRYHETNYLEEKSMLGLEQNKSYSLVTESDTCKPLNRVSTSCIQTVNKMDTQVRLDKTSKDKTREDKTREDKTREDNSQSSIDFSKEEVFKHFERCGFVSTSVLLEKITEDIKIYGSKNLMDAATESMTRGKINNYKYVIGIAQNWLSEGRNEDGTFSKSNKDNGNEKPKYNFEFD